MEPRRKRMRVLSSSESDSDDVPPGQNRKDSHPEADVAPLKSHESGYDSDGNSSVESMDIILYPSASALSEIPNSKQESNKSDEEELKVKNRKSVSGTSAKSEANQAKNKNIFNKTVKNFPKDVSKSEFKLERKNEGQHTIVNDTDVSLDDTKNNNSLLISKEIAIPNQKKEPDPPKKSTVKKRPENYGSRLNSLLKDIKSNSNKNQSSKARKQRPIKPKDRWQIRYKKLEKNSEIEKYDKNSKSQPAKDDSCTEPLPEVEKERQSTSGLCSKDSNTRKLGHNSKLYNLPQSDYSEKSKSDKEFHGTVSKPSNSLKSKYSKNGLFDQNSKIKRAKSNSCTESSPEVQSEKQSPTEPLNSKELKNDDKSGHSSKLSNLSQIPKEGIPSNLEKYNTRREFHETVSQLCKSAESSYNYPNEPDGMYRNKPLCCNLRLIKTIVHFDIKWLEEREKIKKPPLELNKEFLKLPDYFETFDDYHRKYFSMLEVEVWEKICLSPKVNLSHTGKKKFTFLVDDYDFGIGGVMRLNCRSAVEVPTESSLVIVTLKLENGQDKSTFGFIEHSKVSVKGFVFKMFVKPRQVVPKRNIQMEGKFICSLFKETKQAEALHLLKFSPLLKDYLMPTWQTFRTDYNKYNQDFFSVQQNIFDVVSREINISLSEPKIMLLQGPPGSGKTSAIVSIASNLLRNKNDPKKILIVAPSHSALDEIGNQLLKLNESFINPISFVRLGQIENIHHKLLEYSLPRYLEKCQMNRSLNSNLKAINEVSSYISPCNKNSKNLEDQCEMIISKEKLKDILEQHDICTILSDTSLILSVPEDCWQLFNLKVKFSCCLIDEVNQATELDTLYPFALDINKFLLVADHMQLPSNVESETFQQLGYQRSVMERFRSYIIKQFSKNPTIVLSQTFRLNSSIANFPFNHFYCYSNYRERCSYADNRSIFCPFKPYVVLDDQNHHGTRDSPYTNKSGVNFIISLCSFITHHCSTSSIGIIVPSEEDKQTYRVPIANLSSSNVEVNTVDKFQGREKTVIILSTYHNSNNVVSLRADYFSEVRKLNVALTRAISSLIICGPLQETLKYDIWSHIVTDSRNRMCYFDFRSSEVLSDLQPSFFTSLLKEL